MKRVWAEPLIRTPADSELVANSPPDGYTVMVNSATHVANAHIYKKLPYDTMRDFTGVAPLAVQVGMLVVHPRCR